MTTSHGGSSGGSHGPQGGAHGRPSADVSVRVAWADDAPAIAGVQVKAWRHVYDGLLPSDVLEALDPDQFADAWSTSLTRPKDARNRVLVALERNAVRGFAVLLGEPL